MNIINIYRVHENLIIFTQLELGQRDELTNRIHKHFSTACQNVKRENIHSAISQQLYYIPSN